MGGRERVPHKVTNSDKQRVRRVGLEQGTGKEMIHGRTHANKLRCVFVYGFNEKPFANPLDFKHHVGRNPRKARAAVFLFKKVPFEQQVTGLTKRQLF